MDQRSLATTVAVLVLSVGAFAQQSAPTPSASDSSAAQTTTVHGCLNRSRGNYIVVEDKTGLAYVLKGVGDKVATKVGSEVEVSGQLHPGSVKTGTRSTKTGSNPSDTVHGVDGVPIQIANVDTDVKTVAKKCTPSDQQ
jgi:hypothetical protein